MCFIAMSIALALVACLLNLIEVDSADSQPNLGKRDPEAGPSHKTARCTPSGIVWLVSLFCFAAFGLAGTFCYLEAKTGGGHGFETAAKALGGIAIASGIVTFIATAWILLVKDKSPCGTPDRLNDIVNAPEMEALEISMSLNPTRRSSAISIAPHILAALTSIAAMALFLAVLKQRSRTRVNAAAAVQKV